MYAVIQLYRDNGELLYRAQLARIELAEDPTIDFTGRPIIENGMVVYQLTLKADVQRAEDTNKEGREENMTNQTDTPPHEHYCCFCEQVYSCQAQRQIYAYVSPVGFNTCEAYRGVPHNACWELQFAGPLREW